MKLRLETRWAAAVVAAGVACALASACGAKSQLREDGSAASGAGGDAATTTGATTTTTASTTGGTTTGVGGGASCDALTVLDPVPIPSAAGVGWAPSILSAPDGYVYHFSIEPTSGVGTALVVRVLDALAAWPPSPAEPKTIAAPIADYAVGKGPSGPSGLLLHEGAGTTVATQLIPTLDEVDAGVLSDGRPLTIAGVGMGGPQAFLFAEVWKGGIPGVHLNVGSYQLGGLPQQEPPEACISSQGVGGVVPVDNGFLGAFGVTDPIGLFDCGDPLYASAVNVGRYDVVNATPELGYTEGTYLQTKDRLEHVAIARASFGAWVVYQGAGLDAEVPPPIFAFQVDAAGKPIGGGAPMQIPVSPNGSFPDMAVATMGDALAVAWVDVVDPSAPTIGVQVVMPDLSLGPATSFGTNALWFTGRLGLLGSPQLGTLLVSWESVMDDTWQRALARIDCVGAL